MFRNEKSILFHNMSKLNISVCYASSNMAYFPTMFSNVESQKTKVKSRKSKFESQKSKVESALLHTFLLNDK